MLLNVVFAGTASPTSPPPAPPFTLVFDFSYYFRRSFLSFCSRNVLNTDLESWGQYKSREKKQIKIWPLQPSQSRKQKAYIRGQAGMGGGYCLTSCGGDQCRSAPTREFMRFVFRDYEGCSGPIFVLKVAKWSSCPPLKMCCLKIFVSQKLRKLRGSIPHRFTSKLWWGGGSGNRSMTSPAGGNSIIWKKLVTLIKLRAHFPMDKKKLKVVILHLYYMYPVAAHWLKS